jgi:ubiquinone/menaquinone biosynthesis C-methylase UbiE
MEKSVPENRVPTVDYSTIGEHYDERRPVPAEIWISTIVRLGRITVDSDVLDIGCGTGRYTTRVAAASRASIYGVDCSPTMLKNALKSDPERAIRWTMGDAHALPFKSNSFDCAYMTMVFHQIQKRNTLLDEIRRVLRPGGRCIIATSSHLAIREHVLRHFPGATAIDLNRFPSIPALRRSLKKAGFSNVGSTLVRHDEGEIPVQKYLKMVENKYISTLSLLSEAEFERGFEVFRRKVRERYGNRIRRILRFTFVTGEKPTEATRREPS